MHLFVKNGRLKRPYVSRGFTLIELLVLFCMAGLAWIGAVILHKYVGGRFGSLLGGFVGCMALPVTAAIFGLFMSLLRDGIPSLPRCRNGCCRGSDYEICRFDDEFDWVCKCGDRYTRRGRLFLQVTDKGEKILCRTWRPFRGWFPAVKK